MLGDAPLAEAVSGARRRRRPWSASAASSLDPARRADAIVAAVARGQDAEPLPAEVVERPDSNPADVPAIALSEALVLARALDAGLAYELVAARNDLAQVVAAVRRGQPEPVRTSGAGAATWSASSWSCWPGAAPWPSTAPAAFRSAAASRPGRRRMP